MGKINTTMREGTTVYMTSLTLGENTRHEVTVTRAGEGWIAECGSLPGCVGEGSTAREAISGLRAAIRSTDKN
ncbi:MAG: hypothetical protein JXJ17_08890 [Anaerolineae bacterium]|nr:hypothetical protein [Anaerolineae bacterium]